jgi:CBS domain-containing protein
VIIKELARTQVVTVAATSTVQEAALKMRGIGIRGLPVVEQGKVIGFLTDRDIVTRGVAVGLRPAETPVTTVMTRNSVHVREDVEVVSAVQTMRREGVRQLMLIDHQDRLAGIVTIGDLARSGTQDGALPDLLRDVGKEHFAGVS